MNRPGGTRAIEESKMADDTQVTEPELKLEAPNMDEQSAAPKEIVVEPIPDKEKVGEAEKKPAEKIEAVAEVTEPAPETDGFAELPAWAKRELGQKQKQVQERTKKLTEAEQRIAALEEMLQNGKTEQPIEDHPLQTPTQNMTQAQIRAAAEQLREQDRYQEDLARINTAGEGTYKAEWGKALENLAALGTVEMPTMQAILATDAPEKVLYELGKSPAEYQRIMDLPPARRHTEFVKLSLKTAPKAAVSKAPEPVETVRGRVTPTALPQDSDDDETWYAKWNAMQEAKRKRA